MLNLCRGVSSSSVHVFSKAGEALALEVACADDDCQQLRIPCREISQLLRAQGRGYLPNEVIALARQCQCIVPLPGVNRAQNSVLDDLKFIH